MKTTAMGVILDPTEGMSQKYVDGPGQRERMDPPGRRPVQVVPNTEVPKVREGVEPLQAEVTI